MGARAALAVVTICTASLSACASSGGAQPTAHRPAASTGSTCVPPAGGRCPGPEPVRVALYSGLQLSSDGRTISGRFQCGGRLEASETARQVLLTYVASAVGPGAMACALVPLSVHLPTAVGSRTVIDGVSGQHLRVAQR